MFLLVKCKMLLNSCIFLKASQEEILELRQDASDLQEYSNAKIQRVTRYLGVLAEKAHKLGMIQLFVLFSDVSISLSLMPRSW